MRPWLQILWIGLLALLLGACVLRSNRTHKRRQLERELEAEVYSPTRFVDFGVQLRVVVADPVNGTELIPGKPLLTVVRVHRFGGIVDTSLDTPRIVRPTESPAIWYCSEDQEQILLHKDPAKPGQLIYGSEGSGKSTGLAMWQGLRVIEHIGQRRMGGQTAPTQVRFDAVVDEMIRVFPASWFHYAKAKHVFMFAEGSRILVVSTKKQSEAAGSPLQSFNLSWVGVDEGQDTDADVHNDIMARGRSSKGGVYQRAMTATAKDSPDWRTLRDIMLKTGQWEHRTLLGSRSPFVDPSWWNTFAATLSDREKARRIDAQDVPLENRVYPAWDRARNLIEIPELGFEDVTAAVLSTYGPNFGVLIGHDPGSLFDVSIFLKQYQTRTRIPGGTWQTNRFWVVVGELTTEESTTEFHASKLVPFIQERYGCNRVDYAGRPAEGGARALVHADPYGNVETEAKPDKSVYTVLKKAGLFVKPAAFSKTGDGPGQVPKQGGIDMVNTLFRNSLGLTQLFVAKDDKGRPLAPRLVDAIERSEKDYRGKAETQKKNKLDVSHWPAALRYALWPIEKPRLLTSLQGGLT